MLREIAIKIMRGELPAIAADDLKKHRLQVCESCEDFARTSRQCRLCWCFMDLKTELLEAKCPADKW